MTSIFNKAFTPPAEYKLPEHDIILFQTDTHYFLTDFDAVNDSKDYLRAWSSSQWPLDEFTAEDNKQDLQFHVDDNEDHVAYGYMIYSSDLNVCLGSVYVNPLAEWDSFHSLQQGVDPRLQFQARIDYWVRQGDPILEEKILRILIPWFRNVWKIKVLYTTRPALQIRNSLYQKMNLKQHANLISFSEPRMHTWLYKTED